MEHIILNEELSGNNAPPNKSLDVRAKQRLCLVSCPLNSSGLSGGFAPRQLNRYVALGELQRNKKMIAELSDDSNLSAWRWWERRRLRYNVGLFLAGISTFVLYLAVYFTLGNRLPMEIDVTIFTVIFHGIAFAFYVFVANVFYCLGALSERLPRMRSLESPRQMSFTFGFWLSVALPFLEPLLLAYVAFSRSPA